MIRKKFVTIPWILEQERILRTKNTVVAVNWFNILAGVFLCFIIGVLLLRYYDANNKATATATSTEGASNDRRKNMLFFNLA
jgi:hypothetical protein